jgi:hypothetical protein
VDRRLTWQVMQRQVKAGQQSKNGDAVMNSGMWRDVGMVNIK